jgi:CRP-like cAMP-binding protein
VKKHVNPMTARLAAQPLFQGVSNRDLEGMAPLSAAVRLEAGRVLTDEGRIGREVFLLESGEVKVEIDGAEITRLGRGEVVGHRH